MKDRLLRLRYHFLVGQRSQQLYTNGSIARSESRIWGTSPLPPPRKFAPVTVLQARGPRIRNPVPCFCVASPGDEATGAIPGRGQRGQAPADQSRRPGRASAAINITARTATVALTSKRSSPGGGSSTANPDTKPRKGVASSMPPPCVFWYQDSQLSPQPPR